jgi:radical SAM superfamily enzyme YgiQ (UPF0313 family)
MLNPRQYERFFDLMVIGEADEILVKLLKATRLLKGLPRLNIIEELSRFDGVYAPRFQKETVARQHIRNLDKAYHPVRPPIPTVDSIHNRLNVEISRGCGNGDADLPCRCRLQTIQRSVLLRVSVEIIGSSFTGNGATRRYHFFR